MHSQAKATCLFLSFSEARRDAAQVCPGFAGRRDKYQHSPDGKHRDFGEAKRGSDGTAVPVPGAMPR